MKESKDFIESLSRGFSILSVLSESVSPLTLTELAQEAGLSRSTVQRFVYTMETLGLLAKDNGTKTFQVGPKMISIALTIAQNMDVNKAALPYMRETATVTGESVGLAILSGTEVVYTNVVRTTHVLTIEMGIGDRFPAYCTSMGRAFLAFLPKRELETILENANLKRLTPHTIADKGRLLKELETVRMQGFSINDQETHLGLRSVAAPIRSSLGEIVAAVNIIVPTVRSSKKELKTVLAAKIIETADRISTVLGYRPRGETKA